MIQQTDFKKQYKNSRLFFFLYAALVLIFILVALIPSPIFSYINPIEGGIELAFLCFGIVKMVINFRKMRKLKDYAL